MYKTNLSPSFVWRHPQLVVGPSCFLIVYTCDIIAMCLLYCLCGFYRDTPVSQGKTHQNHKPQQFDEKLMISCRDQNQNCPSTRTCLSTPKGSLSKEKCLLQPCYNGPRYSCLCVVCSCMFVVEFARADCK